MAAPAHTRLLLLAMTVLASACDNVDATTNKLNSYMQDPASRAGYRLVGAYDAAALRTMELMVPELQRPKAYEYIWRPHPDMEKACGPVKAPDGLGIFEAEAMANRQMPTLALVVERIGDVPPLDSHRVRVALGEDNPSFFLEPSVSPRYIQVAIEGDVATRYKQQVKTQLQTYLCMEHKTGRAWQGGTGDQVRQALLLNPPDDFRLPDRKFFGGQNEPVPALLGPPQACLKRIVDLDFTTSTGGQGDSSLYLVPSDVWGASLARCNDGIQPRRAYVGPGTLKLSLSEVPETAPRTGQRREWSQLLVKMRSEGDTPDDQFLRVEYDGNEYVDDTEDGIGTLVPEQPLFEKSESGQLGLIDIVSKIPYRYPTIGDKEDDQKYTVLLVPNWQLVEGIRRMAVGDWDKPRGNAGEGIQDGVSWILENPENLFIMVPRDFDDFDALDPGAEIQWNNLARSMKGGRFGERSWGYATGMLTGRAPIALLGTVTPTWAQASLAQRAVPHGMFLGAVTILMLVFFTGAGRLRDLWTRVPEERVEFWPGPPPEEEGEEEDDAGDLAGGEGGEGDG
jgi:hypothetical protein